jgi:hypothetical protein
MVRYIHRGCGRRRSKENWIVVLLHHPPSKVWHHHTQGSPCDFQVSISERDVVEYGKLLPGYHNRILPPWLMGATVMMHLPGIVTFIISYLFYLTRYSR